MRAWVLFFAAAVVVGFAACSSSSTAPTPPCTPGASAACACTDGRSGAQVCLPNRSYAACVCDSDDASTDSSTQVDANAFTQTTLHAIDLGDVTAGVDVRGVYVVSPILVLESQSTGNCEYWASVEDTIACTAPPCGLIVSSEQSKPAGGCPSARDTSTPLANIHQGDTVDVKGIVAVAIQAVDAAEPLVAHFIDIDQIAPSSAAAPKPAGVAIADPSIFAVGSGSGWAAYEGTYVTVSSATKLTVGVLDANGAYVVTPGNGSFGTIMMTIADAGALPDAGSTWTSISGVTYAIQGGFVESLASTDFVP